jgi:type VI secretion system protein ImpK
MPDSDDPFKPSDATILRPRPGGGRRAGGDAGTQVRSAPPPPTPAEPIDPSREDRIGTGLNPLVQAATPLLLLAGQVRNTLAAPDVPALRRHALDEIRLFEERARASGIGKDVVLAARYVLCTALDEAVLSTPWGNAHSDWAQQTLLVTLHREAWGGEKFFDMLDRISQEPERHIDLMELLYLCLTSGFAGKYRVADRGHDELADVRHRLYRRIREIRGTAPNELSLRWQGLQDRRNPLIRYVPWWVVAAAALAVLTIAFVIYYAALSRMTAPVQTELARVGLEDFTRPRAVPPPRGPTLKELLAPEEQRGALSVEEDGGLTRITLLGSDLFASGSATVNTQYNDTLERIADAVRQVPGRVLVVGHTDDQPIQSLRYQDNFALSRERAVSVAKVLQGGIDNAARVEWSGVGSTEPRYRPESTPENRARNRRVEIVHVRG